MAFVNVDKRLIYLINVNIHNACQTPAYDLILDLSCEWFAHLIYHGVHLADYAYLGLLSLSHIIKFNDYMYMKLKCESIEI